LIVLFGFAASGQDIHYSMYDLSPLNLNPALTGAYDGDYRFHGNHRHQWKAVTLPYSTFSMSAEGKGKDFVSVDNLAAGIQINQDRAGDSRFNTFQLNASLAYTLNIEEDTSQTLTFGIQPGVTNRKIDYSSLYFDRQYNGFRYDPSISNGESFAVDSRVYMNLNTGAYYHNRIDDRQSFGVGVSLYNMTKPKQSFFNDNGITLDMRWAIHGRGVIKINEEWDIIPSIAYFGQGTYREMLIGAEGKYILEDYRGIYRAVYVGMSYRNQDAGFISVGMDWDDWRVGMSYDINFSTLKPASNGRGALELAVVRILRIYKSDGKIHRICRDFM